jgi:hypothetical protein
MATFLFVCLEIEIDVCFDELMQSFSTFSGPQIMLLVLEQMRQLWLGIHK